MMIRKMPSLFALLLLAVGTLACNMPNPAAPTPFVFPTANATLTAIFNPTAINQFPPDTATSTAAPGETQVAPTAVLPSATFTAPPTNTFVPPTNTFPPPTNTPVPTVPPRPTEVSYRGPNARPGTSLVAYYFRFEPTIDGSFEEWDLDRAFIDDVVYGGRNYQGSRDLEARVMFGWDEDRLYVAARVIDDVYAQNASGENLFRGDSVELLIDTDVAPDFYLRALNSDDFQIGISPGTNQPGNGPEAYIWYPASLSGESRRVKAGAMRTDDGYRIEISVPWSLLDVNPDSGDHLGFAFSVSDNDRPGEREQQSMISSAPARDLSDPTTWGDLVLSGIEAPRPQPPRPTATPNPNDRPRRGARISAGIMNAVPSIDGNLDDWAGSKVPVVDVVYGSDKWDGAADLSGSVKAAWDNTYLYLGAQVIDNRYIQNSSGAQLFLGDHLEILFDADLNGDFNSQSLSGDDYQLGISPGRPDIGSNREAYLWFPQGQAGRRDQIKIGSIPTADGYQVEVAIPWSVFGISPAEGQRFGFAFSISDNDNRENAVQQTMVSNVDRRVLTDPTTWGELELTR